MGIELAPPIRKGFVLVLVIVCGCDCGEGGGGARGEGGQEGVEMERDEGWMGQEELVRMGRDKRC